MITVWSLGGPVRVSPGSYVRDSNEKQMVVVARSAVFTRFVFIFSLCLRRVFFVRVSSSRVIMRVRPLISRVCVRSLLFLQTQKQKG